MNNSSVSYLRKPLALLGAGLSLFAANAAFAQQGASTDNSGDTMKLEKLVVTGSNIPMAVDALSVPVNVIGIQKMEQSGVNADLFDVLRKSATNISGIGEENATIATGSTFGGAAVNIKGLGTLVLIDGRRVAFSPAESTGGSQFVDLNLIPVAMVERVEVLSDGASAIYGSDAVGGVINIILKKDYNGWEAGAHYGYTKNTGNYTERSGYIVGGVSNDKTSLTVGIDYAQHDAIYLKDRSYTNPIYGTRSFPGLLDVTDGATGADQFYQLNPSLNAPPGGGNMTMAQLVTAGVYAPVSRTTALHVFNLASGETMITYLKRYSAVVNMTHKIFGDSLESFGSIMAANTKTWSSLNAQPVVPYLQDPYVDINLYFGFTPPPAGTTFVPTSAPTNPFSTAYVDSGASDGETGNLMFVRNRFIPYPRLYQNNSTLFRVVGGLKGKINDDYSWEAAANLNRYELSYTNPGLIDTNALQNALANGTINPWARVQAPGAFTGVVGEAFVNMLSTLNSFDAKVTGTPFEMPAGKLAFSLGTSYVREVLGATPDVNSLPNSAGTTQGWSNATTFSDFTARRSVMSYFAEVELPIFSSKQNVVGAHALNVDLAVRNDSYSGNVGKSTVPKYSLSWQPVDDQFKFRASAGKSFVAPQLYSLYGPVSSGASNAINYVGKNGTAYDQVQFNATGGANPNLVPSTATTWAAGFVFTPKAVKNLSITIDYSDIKQKSIVGVIPQETIVQDVENNGTASPYYNLIHINTPTGPLVTGPGQISAHSPQAIWIINQLLNLAGQNVRSTDVAVDYVFNVENVGRFDVSTNFTWYNSYQLQIIPTETFYEYSGLASTNEGTVPKFRFYTILDWKNKGWDAFVANTYITSVTDVNSGGSSATLPGVNVPAYYDFDLGLSYDFKSLHLGHGLDGLKITVGVNNVFNKLPPLAVTAFPNTNADVGTYNGSIGRMIYINAKYSF